LLNGKQLLAKTVENWPAKMLSIALAIILFVFHRISTLEERFFTIPLNIEVQGNLSPSSSFPRVIRVTLRGDANSIYPISEDDIEAFIDLAKHSTPGDYRAAVQVRKKGVALDVETLEISVDPMEVSISLDYKISKFVPLTASLRGSVESGYVLSSHSLNPTQVLIDGPSSLMGSISELSTDFIDLDGKTSDFTVMVNILNRDPLIVIRGNGVTEFHGIISRIIPVRNIIDIPIRINNLREDLVGELDTKAGKVHLESGNQAALDRYNPPINFLSVDCSSIEEPGAYTLEVIPAAIPQGITLSVEPREVTILVSSAGGEEEE
jgi:YbbR domain-containing protein